MARPHTHPSRASPASILPLVPQESITLATVRERPFLNIYVSEQPGGLGKADVILLSLRVTDKQGSWVGKPNTKSDLSGRIPRVLSNHGAGCRVTEFLKISLKERKKLECWAVFCPARFTDLKCLSVPHSAGRNYLLNKQALINTQGMN